ncbi:XkdF-like putative serine protease domain-containing protein [Hymenobacter metallilatus]|uniref:XkdF-like putative serine protease domain-containing protein n=1 Tax=Hymenobacter metallilatus TaxID=2493666 RepID=UPI00163AEC7C|nr:XkdF-like putative serine protease domain-containing protein [Hymenobacter metallilatus]
MYAVQFAPAAPEVGVSLVSFVDKPAIGVDFVALSAEQTLPVALKADAKKQVLTGPVLIPNKQIARLDDKGQLYYLNFSAECIEQMHERFHEQQNTHATNLQHDTALEGNFCKESWLVTDSTQDKAYALGFTAEQVPVGTWMASYKVTDAKLWADEVETGNVKGFSIEGLLAYTTLSAQLSSIQPTPKSVQKTPKPANKLAAFFSELKKLVVGVSLAMLTLDDDSSVEVDDTTGEVFSLDAEGNRGELVADGTYKLKDGGELVVKDGMKVVAAADTTDTTDTAMAATFASGDAVKVQAGKEHMPEHKGLALTIAEVKDGFYAVKLPDGTVHKWYAGDELEATAASDDMKMAEQKLAEADTTETPAAVTMAEITLDTGEVVKHDPISKKLYDASGQLLKSGKYKTADGVMFKVSLDQWWYETTETLSAQLEATEKAAEADKTVIANLRAELAEANLKLKAKPAAAPVKLAGDKGAEKAEQQAGEMPVWKQRLSAAQANGKKAETK